jgi:hypothetical protein
MNERLTPLDPQGAHGIEHLLGCNGAKTNPETVSLNPIRPVVEMSMGGHARIFDSVNEKVGYQVFSLGVGLSAHIDEWVISYGNHQAPANADLVFDLNHSLRIIALSYMVHIESPGVGPVLDGCCYRVSLHLTRGGQYVPFWNATHGIRTDPGHANSQEYQYPGDWMSELNNGVAGYSHRWGSSNQIRCPIIPPTWGVQMDLNTICLPPPDGGHWTFPQDSYAYIWILAQQVPVGAPIPSYWE